MKVYRAFNYDPAHPENFPWNACTEINMEVLGEILSKAVKDSEAKSIERADTFRDALAYIAGVAVVPDVKEIEVRA